MKEAKPHITGMENLPELGKFRVHLSCGHTVICDHSVSKARASAFPCPRCEEEKAT
jgi:predicted RNA-binding Zn-ribbon protein involved in translation (DUF1610 family)